MNIQERKSNLFNLIQRVQDIERLDILERILKKFENKTPNALTPKETDYLTKINEPIPDEVIFRFQELRKKQKIESLGEKDMKEMVELIDIIELAEANRLEYMLKLANYWNISIDELRSRLEIPPPNYFDEIRMFAKKFGEHPPTDS